MNKSSMSITQYSSIKPSKSYNQDSFNAIHNNNHELRKLKSVNFQTKPKHPQAKSTSNCAQLRYLILNRAPNYNIHNINLFNINVAQFITRNAQRRMQSYTSDSNEQTRIKKVVYIKYRENSVGGGTSPTKTNINKKKRKTLQFEIKGEKLVTEGSFEPFNTKINESFENKKLTLDESPSPIRYCPPHHKSSKSPIKRPHTTLSESVSKMIPLKCNAYALARSPSVLVNYRGMIQMHLERRERMVNSPIVVFIFDGVIGDFYKPCLFLHEKEQLWLRPSNMIIRAKEVFERTEKNGANYFNNQLHKKEGGSNKCII